jgi:hypothetical protein
MRVMLQLTRIGTALMCLGLLSLPTGKAAEVFATNPTGTWNNAGSAASIGTPVTVGSTALTVSALGFFDEGGNGLLSSHEVGIYDLSQTLLGSVTIPAGTGATLANGTRWVTLGTPINLSANTNYVLATTFQGTGDRGNVATPAQITIASGISLSGLGFTRALGGTLAYPGQLFGDGEFIFGANMQFTPVPEPSTYVMGVIAAGMAALFRRRRRKA